LRYASHIYGTKAYNYFSQDYQRNLKDSRANDLSYKLEFSPDLGSLLRIDQAFHFDNQVLELGNISSFISLFGDVPWFSFTANNTINPQKEDWGNILLEARLQEGAFVAIAKHRQDLKSEAIQSDSTILLNETQTALNLQYQLTPEIRTSVKTAYNHQPLKPVANNQARYWEALDFSVRFYEDGNSAQFTYSHDLNNGEARFYNFQTQFRVEDIHVAVDQSLWPQTLFKHSNNWRFTWDDVVGIELSNFPFLSLSQYFDDDVYDRTERIRVFDDVNYMNFEVAYSRSFDSRLERNNIIGNYQKSLLSLKLSTNRLYSSDKLYWLKARSALDYRLADALQKDSYLDRFSFGFSFANTDSFALATEFSYQGIYIGDKVDQHLSTLKQLTATAKITDNTYISASLKNPWTYSSNAVNPITWSPFPTFYMIYEPNGLDFYAFVESETGTIGIGLGFSDLLGFQLQDGRSLVLP